MIMKFKQKKTEQLTLKTLDEKYKQKDVKQSSQSSSLPSSLNKKIDEKFNFITNNYSLI